MLKREFSKRGVRRYRGPSSLSSWDVTWLGSLVTYCDARTSSGDYYSTRKQAIAGFRKMVAKRLADGFKETERSLSRRVFEYPSGIASKFWAIRLDATTLIVQFGRMRDGAGDPDDMGTSKRKRFATRKTAMVEYHKLIAAKVKAGYSEIAPRKTPYSSPAT